MFALLALFALLCLVGVFFGFALKGLFWLAIICVVLFLAASVGAAITHRR